uniref:F-box domain-containing protein n=1 Tax=Panagrolaimus sp. PS1159 TaxID=55785 RepID=A0AC35G4Q8_9BILA
MRFLDLEYKDLSFPLNVIDHLLGISLQYIFLSHFSDQNYLLKLAFSKLQRLRQLESYSFKEITPKTFKDLIGTNQMQKKVLCFKIGRLSYDIKAEEIFQFHDIHMNTHGEFRLWYHTKNKILSPEAEKLLSEIQTIMNVRKERRISTCKIIIDFVFREYEFPEIPV